MMKQCLLFILLSLCTAVSQAEIYKWVDESGKVQYGDKPADENAATKMNVNAEATKKENATPDEREERSRRMADTLQEDRLKKKEDKEKQAQTDAKIKQQQQRCLYARDHLRRLEEAGAIYDLDKAGNRVYQSSEQREVSIAQFRDQIAKNCQ